MRQFYCPFAGKCLLEKLDWTDGGWDPKMDVIKADLPKLATGASLAMTVEDCKKETDDGDDGGKFLRCIFYYVDMACRRKANHLLWMAQRDAAPGEAFTKGWKEEDGGTGIVPDHLDEVPPAPLVARFSSGSQASSGGAFSTAAVGDEPPMVWWDADPSGGVFYTLLVVDFGLANNNRFIHYMVNNIPGNMVKDGEESMSWVKPFA